MSKRKPKPAEQLEYERLVRERDEQEGITKPPLTNAGTRPISLRGDLEIRSWLELQYGRYVVRSIMFTAGGYPAEIGDEADTEKLLKYSTTIGGATLIDALCHGAITQDEAVKCLKAAAFVFLKYHGESGWKLALDEWLTTHTLQTFMPDGQPANHLYLWRCNSSGMLKAGRGVDPERRRTDYAYAISMHSTSMLDVVRVPNAVVVEAELSLHQRLVESGLVRQEQTELFEGSEESALACFEDVARVYEIFTYHSPNIPNKERAGQRKSTPPEFQSSLIWVRDEVRRQLQIVIDETGQRITEALRKVKWHLIINCTAGHQTVERYYDLLRQLADLNLKDPEQARRIWLAGSPADAGVPMFLMTICREYEVEYRMHNEELRANDPEFFHGWVFGRFRLVRAADDSTLTRESIFDWEGPREAA